VLLAALAPLLYDLRVLEPANVAAEKQADLINVKHGST
jgi:hypothetical protein